MGRAQIQITLTRILPQDGGKRKPALVVPVRYDTASGWREPIQIRHKKKASTMVVKA
jgi:hypothetical protein